MLVGEGGGSAASEVDGVQEVNPLTPYALKRKEELSYGMRLSYLLPCAYFLPIEMIQSLRKPKCLHVIQVDCFQSLCTKC